MSKVNSFGTLRVVILPVRPGTRDIRLERPASPTTVRPLLWGKPSNRVLAAHAHRGAELVEKCALVFLVRQLPVSPSRQEDVVFLLVLRHVHAFYFW